MRTRNVVLTDHQADLIDNWIESGRFQNASEALREGLRLVEQREAENAARVEALRTAIAVGDADIEAGRSKVFKGPALRKHLRSLTRAALGRSKRDARSR